jgi:CDP-diacylglycerol--glycerol-3-phosphate 3-phosphatidyltransferase
MQWTSRRSIPSQSMDRGRIEEKSSDLETASIYEQYFARGFPQRASYSMNWANRLTLSRLALTVFFVVALNSSWQYARTTALILFLVAGLTDFIDGEIARRYGVITNFGKLMDPLVDKIMMAAAFISLVPLKAVPAWAATAVVARDFLITGLRLMATAKGRILPAERLGKQKTSWQIITIVFFLALLSMAELQYVNEKSTWWVRAWTEAGPVLVWITVALTLYSALGFAWRNRELITLNE